MYWASVRRCEQSSARGEVHRLQPRRSPARSWRDLARRSPADDMLRRCLARVPRPASVSGPYLFSRSRAVAEHDDRCSSSAHRVEIAARRIAARLRPAGGRLSLSARRSSIARRALRLLLERVLGELPPERRARHVTSLAGGVGHSRQLAVVLIGTAPRRRTPVNDICAPAGLCAVRLPRREAQMRSGRLAQRLREDRRRSWRWRPPRGGNAAPRPH